jgi:hypothetical protein
MMQPRKYLKAFVAAFAILFTPTLLMAGANYNFDDNGKNFPVKSKISRILILSLNISL